MLVVRQRIRGADLVGITALTPALPQIKAIVESVKKIDPSLPVVAGGPHATLFPKETLSMVPADYVVQGDGEDAIRRLRDRILGAGDAPIPGVWSRTPTGVQSGPPPQPLSDLDSLPFPARHLVHSYAYGWAFDPRMKPGEFTSLITSRGCPFACRFCSRTSISSHRYRLRSITSITQELHAIADAGYHSVAFMDDCFPPPRERAHALFDAILAEHLDLRFYVTAARVDLADRVLYEKMKQAGVVSVQFGCESGCQEILDFYEKRTTVAQIQDAVRLSHAMGFVTIGTFILGAPHETVNQMNTTVRLAKSLPFDSVSFLPLRYMAGSELWEAARREGKIASDEYIVLADAAHGLSRYTAEELVHLCQIAQWGFYLRPRYIAQILASTVHRNDASFLRSFFASLLP